MYKFIFLYFCLISYLTFSCTAGAMRLPGTGEPDRTGPSHFMTDFYSQKFQLPLKQFINTGDKGYLSFYGETPIQMSGK